MNCPVCGKLLFESKAHNEVICHDPDCKFNNFVVGIDESNGKDFSCKVEGYRVKEGVTHITKVKYY